MRLLSLNNESEILFGWASWVTINATIRVMGLEPIRYNVMVA